MDSTTPFQSFLDLHRPGDPFVLPNAWDVGSARAMVAAGFHAVGTTSLGVAASHGILDATRAAHAAIVQVAHDLVAADLGCPVTADLEDGLSGDPTDVADLVASLRVTGINIEDATDGELVDPSAHAAKIAAVKEATPSVFVNARTDTYWLGGAGQEQTLERLRRYVDAGADGVFVPGALDQATIASITSAIDAPLNVLPSATLTRNDLASLGVARISTGSLPYRAALTQAVAAVTAVRDGQPPLPAMSYAQVQAMHGPGG